MRNLGRCAKIDPITLFLTKFVQENETYIFCELYFLIAGRYSDSLRVGRSGDRIPVGAKFTVPIQTGPGAHPASYAMGTDSFPGVKRPRRGVDHPTPSSAEVEEILELYF
jgi:hypothetical protein